MFGGLTTTERNFSFDNSISILKIFISSQSSPYQLKMIEKQLHQAETKAQRNSPNNNFHNKLSSIFTILSLLYDNNKWSYDSKQDDNINKNQKPEKIDIIILPDTHPDPRTMMIIPLHTVIAYSAVNSPDRSVNMTLNTIFLSNT